MFRADLLNNKRILITGGGTGLGKGMAQRFLAERRMGECPCRFDVVAIDNRPGQAPVVRLHEDAFSPQM